MIVGWLTRDDANSRWICKTTWIPRTRHRLQIAVPNLTGRATGWTVIGTADPQKGVIVEQAHAPEFKKGCPIFAANLPHRSGAQKGAINE